MLERLEAVRTLREGGEGRVVLAYDPALSRWLAVKLVRLRPGARAVGEALLGKLAAYAKDMLEPAVVPILESGLLEPEAAPFGLPPALYLTIVMPYVHGLPAHELAQGPLGTKEAAALFTAAAKALARLHGQGLLHLDLKPDNVLVDVQGRVVLVDPLLALVHGSSAYAAREFGAGSARRLLRARALGGRGVDGPIPPQRKGRPARAPGAPGGALWKRTARPRSLSQAVGATRWRADPTRGRHPGRRGLHERPWRRRGGRRPRRADRAQPVSIPRWPTSSKPRPRGRPNRLRLSTQ